MNCENPEPVRGVVSEIMFIYNLNHDLRHKDPLLALVDEFVRKQMGGR